MRKDDSDILLLTLLMAMSPNLRADREPPHGSVCKACEHCKYLWWERDMGKSIPHCKLGMEMTNSCEEYKANSLYESYIEKFGKEQ